MGEAKVRGYRLWFLRPGRQMAVWWGSNDLLSFCLHAEHPMLIGFRSFVHRLHLISRLLLIPCRACRSRGYIVGMLLLHNHLPISWTTTAKRLILVFDIIFDLIWMLKIHIVVKNFLVLLL